MSARRALFASLLSALTETHTAIKDKALHKQVAPPHDNKHFDVMDTERLNRSLVDRMTLFLLLLYILIL